VKLRAGSSVAPTTSARAPKTNARGSRSWVHRSAPAGGLDLGQPAEGFIVAGSGLAVDGYPTSLSGGS
jgi:hypothetical protein